MQLALSPWPHAKPDTCRLFGGARLEKVTAKDATVTFADIAGVDQVKAEIIELVQFLKSPQRFLDLGARSPAGVLLVGSPGTGVLLHNLPLKLCVMFVLRLCYGCVTPVVRCVMPL